MLKKEELSIQRNFRQWRWKRLLERIQLSSGIKVLGDSQIQEVEESSESEAGSIEAGATNKNESQRNQFLPQLPPVPDDATNVNIDGFVFTELA